MDIKVIDKTWKEEWVEERIYYHCSKECLKDREQGGWYKVVKDNWKDRPNKDEELRNITDKLDFSEKFLVTLKILHIFRRIKINCALCNKESEIKLEMDSHNIHYPDGLGFCKLCLNRIRFNDWKKHGGNINAWYYKDKQHPEYAHIRVQYIEEIRRALGLSSTVSVGEKILWGLIKEIYPNEIVIPHDTNVLRHLNIINLHLDFHLPELKLAFEYQGEQHFKQECFGRSEEEFNKQQENDRIKREECKRLGITLIEFRYDEPLTRENLVKKIKIVEKVFALAG